MIRALSGRLGILLALVCSCVFSAAAHGAGLAVYPPSIALESARDPQRAFDIEAIAPLLLRLRFLAHHMQALNAPALEERGSRVVAEAELAAVDPGEVRRLRHHEVRGRQPRREQVGEENFLLFGLTAAEVEEAIYFGTDTHCHMALADGTEVVARLQSPANGEAFLNL